MATGLAPRGPKRFERAVRPSENIFDFPATWAGGNWFAVWDYSPILDPPSDPFETAFASFSSSFELSGAISLFTAPGLSSGVGRAVAAVPGGIIWLSNATGFRSPGVSVDGMFLTFLDRDGTPTAPSVAVTERPELGAFSTSRGLAVETAGKSVLVAYLGGSRSPTGGVDTFARRFSLTGEPLGPSELLNQTVRGVQWLPSIVTVPGGFWAVWEQQAFEEILGGVFGRRLDAKGRPVGSEFRVDQLPVNDPSLHPTIAADEHGNFLVVWKHFDGSTFDRWDVKSRLYRADGTPVSREFVVNHARGNDQERPMVAYAHNGTFIVGWEGYNQYGNDVEEDVFVRRISASPGDEACVVTQGLLLCDTGRTGGAFEIRHPFGKSASGPVLLGDIDRDGREDPCEYTGTQFRCDTDHEGEGAERRIAFKGPGTPLMGDVDGDGQADPCLYTSNRFACDAQRNGGGAEVVIRFGEPGETPLLGDVNGDGRDDACAFVDGVFRCETKNNGGGPEVLISFGQVGDQPLLGDFDGDGDDDPCVYRAGQLLCDTRHDGGVAEGALAFGAPGDRVILGNLDGL